MMKILFLIFLALYSTSIVNALCPAGSLEGLSGSGQCYKVFLGVTNYSMAVSKCLSSGGQLASVKNAYTNIFLSSTLVDLLSDPSTFVWLGGDRIDSQWHWIDGTPFAYTNWDQNQPKSGANCLIILPKSGKWSAVDCALHYSYLCELPVLPELTTIPSTCTTCPTCPTVKPCQPCPTQNKNYVGWPKDSTNYDNGWIYLASADSYYKFFNESYNWSTAESICNQNGGHLASVHSVEEDGFLNYLSKPANILLDFWTHGVWIGLKKQANGQYQWSDGSVLDYSNYADEDNLINDCMYIIPGIFTIRMDGSFEWIDGQCDIQLSGFLCKK